MVNIDNFPWSLRILSVISSTYPVFVSWNTDLIAKPFDDVTKQGLREIGWQNVKPIRNPQFKDTFYNIDGKTLYRQ